LFCVPGPEPAGSGRTILILARFASIFHDYR
jgi:hypothetical protein